MSESIRISIERISDLDWSQTPERMKRYLMGRIERLERQYAELKVEKMKVFYVIK